MISVVILTKNEENTIKECVTSVLWADEILVIDDYSEDQTASLAKASGALVYFHALEGDFAAQRNFGLEKAKGDWVLFLDADERVSEDLQQEIQLVLSARRNRYTGYRFHRTDFLFGRRLKHGETGAATFLRLAKREAGKWYGLVHEVWHVDGHITTLTEPLLHYPHQTVREFLADINDYTDIRAQELYKKRVHVTWYHILLYTKAKFIKNYFFYLGILDGMPGLVSAIMMSFHSFLVRSKLWLLWQKK